MRSLALRAVLGTLCTAFAAVAGPPTAWEVTERDRGLRRAVSLAAAKGPRTVLFLVDASPSLRRTEFVGAFLAARAEHGDGKRLGVLEMGEREAAFGEEADVALRRMLARPYAYIRNVYAEARQAIRVLHRRPGPRVLVVVTMDNGDLEDEDPGGLERTAMLLKRARTRCHVVTREVVVADNYGRRRLGDPPRDCRWAGPAAAFAEFPQRFVLQLYPNEQASSGFAFFGLTRLAAATGGRVYLSNLPGRGHRCTGGGLSCLLCRGDHAPTDRHYLPPRLRVLAPSVARRRDVLRAARRDPYLRATLEVWDEGARAGLFDRGPALRPDGAALKRVRPREGFEVLQFNANFGPEADRARRLVEDCTELIAVLDGAFETARKHGGGSYRTRANADVTRALLKLTRLNLKLYAHWCEEVAPVLVARDPRTVAPPEISYDFDETERLVGSRISYVGLCHGVAPLRRLKIPGRRAHAAEFDAFEREFARITRTYAHTPYAEILRRSALAWPRLAVRGTDVEPPRGNVGSEKDDTTTRPGRQPAPSAGSDTAGGTTSGGGG